MWGGNHGTSSDNIDAVFVCCRFSGTGAHPIGPSASVDEGLHTHTHTHTNVCYPLAVGDGGAHGFGGHGGRPLAHAARAEPDAAEAEGRPLLELHNVEVLVTEAGRRVVKRWVGGRVVVVVTVMIVIIMWRRGSCGSMGGIKEASGLV